MRNYTRVQRDVPSDEALILELFFLNYYYLAYNSLKIRVIALSTSTS